MNQINKNIYTFALGVLFLISTPLGAIFGSNFSKNSLLHPFIHSNITYQVEFDDFWDQIYSESDKLSAEQAAELFKQSLKNPFFLGVSSSAFQVEGGIGEESSWHRFAIKKGKALPGKAIDFWNQFKN